MRSFGFVFAVFPLIFFYLAMFIFIRSLRGGSKNSGNTLYPTKSIGRQKETWQRKSSVGTPMTQQSKHRSGSDVFGNTEKTHRHIFDSECKEIDCGLDERIFGSKNEKKDIF